MKLLRPARKPIATYKPYDMRYPFVAENIKRDISSQTRIFEVEHIGSTAISGAGGKGIIDLMALYPEGTLEETKEMLLSIGFCKQGEEFAYQWPEHRPMLLGNYAFDKDIFLVYIHIVKRNSDEVHRFRVFRERLKNMPELMNEYCDIKKSIIAEGVTDTDVYVKRKRPIIKKILGPDYMLKNT
jgi:GrpB-like predicted nucleotidyltransferase (UPF0157 family)